MLNLQDNNVSGNNQILGSPILSIILPTQHDKPVYQSPEDIKKIIPNGITFEIIVAHYGTDTSTTPSESLVKSDKDQDTIDDKFYDSTKYFEVKVDLSLLF